jgi:hypothetical protein
MAAAKQPASNLQLLPSGPPAPPPDRGRLLFPDQVAAELFGNRVNGRWCRRHVAPGDKIRLSKTRVAWWEADVLRWLESQKAGAA